MFAVMNQFEAEERVALAELLVRFTAAIDEAVKVKKRRH
jgi:hypothetical protein